MNVRFGVTDVMNVEMQVATPIQNPRLLNSLRHPLTVLNDSSGSNPGATLRSSASTISGFVALIFSTLYVSNLTRLLDISNVCQVPNLVPMAGIEPTYDRL